MTSPRPDCIAHWQDFEETEAWSYSGDDERMSLGAAFGRRFGLTRIGIHHERLPPGHRSSYPHAESAEEEFVYVIEGTPDVRLDGDLHRLRPGDAVGFPAGTGLCHTFINNSDQDVRLLVVGEATKSGNRIFYPRNPDRRPMREDWWNDVPVRPMGDHDGVSDRVRDWRAGRRPTQD